MVLTFGVRRLCAEPDFLTGRVARAAVLANATGTKRRSECCCTCSMKQRVFANAHMYECLHVTLMHWRLVGVTRPLTVSTAQLKAFLPVHLRPINPVVSRGSFVLRQASLILRGASRLDAFSVYPCQT